MKQWAFFLRRSISDVQAKRPPFIVSNAAEKSPLASDAIENCKRRLYQLVRSDPQQARSLMADLEASCQPSLHLFNVLLRGKIMLRDVEGIRATLIGIVKSGFAFNAITVNLLLSYYRDLDRMEEAEKLFNAVLARADLGQGVRAEVYEHAVPFINCPGPSLGAYTTMISGWARRRNYAKVCEYFGKLEKQGELKPDEHLLGAMLNAAVDSKDEPMALRMRRLLHGKNGLSFLSLKALLRASLLMDGSKEELKSYLSMAAASAHESEPDLLRMSELLQWGLDGGVVALRRAFTCIEYLSGKLPLVKVGDLRVWNSVLERLSERGDWEAFTKLVCGEKGLVCALGSRMLSMCPDPSLVKRIRGTLDQIETK
jgi:pentatricopeptide repeat protein